MTQWNVCNSWADEERQSARTRTLHAAQIIKLPHADKKVKTRKPFAVSIRTAQRNCKGICEVPGLIPGTETAYADSFAKLPSEPPDKSDGSNANHDTWSDNKVRELIAVKVLHTSLLNTTVVAFKVLPLRSYAPMPAPSSPFKTILELVLWNVLQSCRCITPDVINVIKIPSFQYFLYVREKKKVTGGYIR